MSVLLYNLVKTLPEIQFALYFREEFTIWPDFEEKILKNRVSQVSKTVVFRNSTAITLLLKNTTVRNPTSGYHPLWLLSVPKE